MTSNASRKPRSFARVLAALLALSLGSLLAPGLGVSGPARADEPPKPDREAPRKRDGADERQAPTGKPECVDVRTEARYVAYGYDHIVEVDNRCERAVDCTIATDVNPAPTTLLVPPGQKRSVTTFRGSPAREFKADVKCKEQS